MMELFRGYVPTKNKKCLIKFKDAPLMSFDEVRDLPEYAGILDEDTILIDIDDKEQSDKLLKIVEDKDAFPVEEYGIAVKKGNTELLNKIKAYKDELKDGVMKKKERIEAVGYKKYMEEK